jgi:hypothetical protein
VHIDCDLYEPIVAALNYFYPRMVPGGFMVIHDYSSLAWNGAERAVDEFFADKLEYVMPLTDGCGSAVIRRAIPLEPPPALALGKWIKGGEPALSDLLGKGWSKPESWGVWGVGDTHRLVLMLPNDFSSPARLELDCAAALVGNVNAVEVRISATRETGQESSAIWHFTKTGNRSARFLALPAGDPGPLTITICTSTPVRPSEHDPANKDGRVLGISLHGIRVSAE